MAVQINVAANQAALTASIQAGVQAYNQRFAQNNQINLSINQRGFSQPLGRITGDVKDFEAALAASNARVIAFGASTAVLGGVIRSFKELANVTIEVEKNLADINRVFGLTTSQLQKFSTDLFNVTKLTASSFDDASKAALEFSRQGLKAEETLQRTKDALTLTRLAGISTANAVDALTSTVNGFAATGISTTQILNKLVAVEQDYAVGAGDLAEALSRTGQAAQEAGVSLDQLNALVTSAQQSTARGGAVIGNALKTIFTRLQRTDTLDQLEAFNISVRDVQGNILPAVQILQNFAGAYKGLADAQRAQLSEQVAGVYQVNILKAIVNDLNKSQGTYAGALQRGAAATNEAEVATAKLNQTLDALLKQTATSTQQLANNIGKVTFEPLAKYGTEQLKSFIESLNEVLEGEGVGSTFANGLLKGIRNVIAGPGAIAAFFTLFKLIQNSFTYLSQALPQIAGITTETQNRKNIEQSILQIMQQQGPVSQALAGNMGNQAAQAQLLLQVARQQTAEYQMQTTLAKQLAVQLAGQGVRVKGAGGLQVTRAGGYIPNATKMAEVVGAQAGGYTPGRVVSSPVGGVMNTAEDVKYIPGFAQPFINPPVGSKAGRAHRQNAISRTGVDPYMYSGFIPNFVNKKGINPGERGNQFEKLINKSLTGVESQAGSELLDFPFGKNSLNSASLIDKNRISLNSNTFFGDAKIKSTKETQRDLVKKLVGSLDSFTYGKLITRANKTKSHIIDLNDFLPIKPSLISNKSVVTSDKENASIEAVLGFDVIEKLARLYKNNKNTERLTAEIAENTILKLNFIDDYVTIPDFSNSGFIPNFAPPTSAIRIPWFKKFGNPAFDAIQPALGISKASDTETFRQINFKSTAEGADERGDSNIFAPLFEDFAFKAMQLVSQPDIKNDLIRGYVLQPKTNQKQAALDAALQESGIGIEYKGYPKKNLPGSITGELTRKYETLSKSNPAAAAKLKELIIAFNEVGHENQITSELGKKLFGPLAGTSYSQMVKNSPDLVKGLSAETNSLLNSYVKNPAFLAMASASGFIPNFAYKQAVMGLEESMSGNKAIFDTKPFPHIRNSSQPTFSSAIADHGGLGNALSDSMRGQKAAGLMSKGFVPNFAPARGPRVGSLALESMDPSIIASSGTGSPVLPNSIRNSLIRSANDLIKQYAAGAIDQTKLNDGIRALNSRYQLTQQSQQKLQTAVDKQTSGITAAANNSDKFAKSLSSASTAISLAGPMIAGFVEQAAFGDRKRTDMSATERGVQSGLSTGLTAISTGAGIGAAFGPLGAGIGAAAGALVGLTSALNATKLSAEELAQLNEEQTQKAQANISAASSYVEAQKSLTDMVAKGASSTEIETATKNLANNFSQIKDTKLQEMFLSAGGDVAIMTRQLQEYTNQVAKESAKQTGLYGGNLKSEERASALSIGLGKEGSSNFIKEYRKSLKKATIEAQFYAEKYGGATDLEEQLNFFKNQKFTSLAESMVPQNEPERESKVKALTENILNKNFEEVLKALEKNISVTDYSKSLQSFRKVSTESFESIFKKIERSLQQTAFETAMEFEKNSSQQRINAAVLDFTTSLTDQMNSFIMGNLPDLSKFEYAQKAATDKSSAALQKLSADRSKFELDQENQKNEIIQKNAVSLTKTFKESMQTSQANAEFFRDQVLTQFTKGNYNLNIEDFAKNMMQGRQADFRSILKNNQLGLPASFGDFSNEGEVNAFRTTLQQTMQRKIAATPDDQKQQVERSFNEMLLSFNDAINATELTKNQNVKNQLRLTLESIKEEKIRSDQRIANAEKEFAVNETITKQKIKAEEILAVEKAKIDSQNMVRLKAMEAASKRLGFDADISKAQGEARISNIERSLNDPRVEFGMGARQITERRIQAERDILQERRGIEDAALSIEMKQAQMQLDAEIANTNALIDLNNSVLQLVNNNLSQTLGGSDEISRIGNIYNTGGLNAVTDLYGQETATNFQAYQTNELKLQSNQSAKNNALQQDQQKLLQEQFQTRQRILGVQRQSIDADVAQKQQLERMKASFSGRFQLGLGGLRNEGDQILLKLGEDLPRMFADGLVDGIKAAIRESNNLGEALLGIASKFLDEISTAMMRSAIYGLLGSVGMGIPGVGQALGGKQKGGIIRAQSGMYISGTGSGDKYPALLENGEYVLNRNAVMAMGGPANLDKLNFSMAPRFASGGSFSQELTDLQSMEAGMTTSGLENSKLYGELRDAERQKQEEKRQKRRQRKQMIAGIVGSLAAAAASFGIAKGISSLPKSAAKLETNASLLGSPEQMTIINGRAVMPGGRQTGGLIGSRLSDTIPAYAEGGLYNSPIVKKYGVGLQNGGMGSSVNNSNVVNNSNATNSFNFNTNVNRDGTIEVGSNSTSYKQQDVELSQNLNNKIYGAVLGVIKDQQRFGGSLAGTRRAT